MAQRLLFVSAATQIGIHKAAFGINGDEVEEDFDLWGHGFEGIDHSLKR